MFKFSKLFTLFLIIKVCVNYSTAQVALYGQCGGIGYSGSTVCAIGTTCYVQQAYYSQCLTSCPAGWQCQGKNFSWL